MERPPLSPADRMASVIGKIINMVPHWTTKLYIRKFECFCCLKICTYHLHMGYSFLSNSPNIHNSIEDSPQITSLPGTHISKSVQFLHLQGLLKKDRFFFLGMYLNGRILCLSYRNCAMKTKTKKQLPNTPIQE